jgi:hypothetical protein
MLAVSFPMVKMLWRAKCMHILTASERCLSRRGLQQFLPETVWPPFSDCLFLVFAVLHTATNKQPFSLVRDKHHYPDEVRFRRSHVDFAFCKQQAGLSTQLGGVFLLQSKVLWSFSLL